MHSSPSDNPQRHPPADARSVELPLDVDITFQLETRRRRQPDFEAEERAVAMLASEMVEQPRLMLHTLVRLAAELCRADAAGVSLLDGELFRWEAVAASSTICSISRESAQESCGSRTSASTSAGW